MKAEYGEKQPGIIFFMATYYPLLIIRDPEILEQLYGPYNKYFEKAYVTRDIFHKLTGDSILFELSTDFWS